MIHISRRQIRRFLDVARRALALTARSGFPPVLATRGAQGLSLQVASAVGAVECVVEEEPAGGKEEELLLPWELLAACEGRAADAVTLEQVSREKVAAAWLDGGVPQLVQLAAPSRDQSPSISGLPTHMAENPVEIFSALQAAVETTDQGSSRFALGAVQLQGGSGQIVATDGRQLLVQGGFAFPWDEDVLLPASRLFVCKELPKVQPVQIGKSDKQVVFSCGTWTIWQTVDEDGRFPDVAGCTPQLSSTTTHLEIADGEAAYLMGALKKLPVSVGQHDALTVELNGQVVLRAQGEHQPHPTELVLPASGYQGEPLRFNMNRRYLERALRLGFRQLHLLNNQSPVLCQDQRRTYIWALLEPDGCIPPSVDATRIGVPAAEQSTAPRARKWRAPAMS